MKQSRSLPPTRILAGLSAAALGFLPAIAAAHPGHYHPPGEDDEFDAFTAGLAHPLGGIDHLILAVAAGWLAFSWKGGKARVPFLTFLASLAIGAWTGRGFQAGAGLEIALALTLIAAGAAFVLGKNIKLGLFISAVSIGGFIHGFAHGAEAAANVPFPSYFAGFFAGTALLLGLGGLLHFAASKNRQPLIPQLAGAALLAVGSVSLIQAF